MESLIELFFESYICTEFDISGFRISLLSERMNYTGKYTLIISAIDSAIRQFSLVVQNGDSDFELLQFLLRV